MLYIFCALFGEAKCLLEKYKLERDMSFNHYQVFGGEDMVLTVTGTGVLSAAMAVTEVCTRIPPVSCDVLFNVGICGADMQDASVGNVYLLNKISDDVTGQDYYPDILRDYNIPEAGLYTVITPKYVEGALTDMEASGIYAAGEKFFTADRMIFLKSVSDKKIPVPETEDISQAVNETIAQTVNENISQTVSMDTINSCMSTLLRKTECIIDDILKRNQDTRNEDPELTERVERLAEDMRLSVTMASGLKQLFRFMAIEGMDAAGEIDRIYKENELPVTAKVKGKKIYDGLYEAVFSHLR